MKKYIHNRLEHKNWLRYKKGSHALRRLPFYIYLSVINYSASQFPLAKRL